MAIGLLLHRVDVEFDCVPKEAAEAFEDSAGKVSVVFLVEDFEEIVDSHRDADRLVGLAAEVLGEAIKLEVVGNEGVVTRCR